MDKGTSSVIISGPEVRKLSQGPGRTLLLVALGLRETSPTELRIDDADNPYRVIAEILSYCKERGCRVLLTSGAQALVQSRIDLLKQFRTATQLDLTSKVAAARRNASATLRRTVLPFQDLSVAHLIEVPFSANFSVPGSGKTVMFYAAYSVLKSEGKVDKAFVVCPRAAFDTWIEEYRACFGSSPSVATLTGTPEERAEIAAAVSQYELFLCSFQMLVNEVRSARKILASSRFVLVIDEAHHVKRGKGGAWYDAIRSISDLSTRRVILTGTPAPNTLLDLGPQLEILWPGIPLLPTTITKANPSVGLEELRKNIAPLYTRVRKRDLGLQEPTRVPIEVKMGPVQARIYRALTHKVLAEITGSEPARAFLRQLRKSLVVRLLQAASNPSLLSEYSVEFRVPPMAHEGVELDELVKSYSSFEFPEKLRVASQLAKLHSEGGEKVVVWTSFIRTAETISSRLTGMGVGNACVTGLLGTDEAVGTRETEIRRFKVDPSVRVLVATIPSVGESVSLHRVCHKAIYVDRTFNCGLVMQSMDRIHRIGLTPDVNVQYLVLQTPGTIDAVVNARLDSKMVAMHRLLNDDIGVLDLDVPDNLAEVDWDTEDIEALVDFLRRSPAS